MEDLNQIMQQRHKKAEELTEAGVNTYANNFRPEHRVKNILERKKEAAEGEPDAHAASFTIAGRIMALRKFGKASFLHIQDDSGRIQVYVKRDVVGTDLYQVFKKLDIGDIVGFSGPIFLTRTGELTVQAKTLTVLTKSLRPLPEKFHGLTNKETRYRQRYLDLIVTPESRDRFRARIEIIRMVREFLANRGFMEVETPMMQAIAGGATAKPFKTHHNALGLDLYLRIAPELYLKRLLVGGFERVFEVNRNFRNEGLSTRHNPEFTMLEFYQAYATYHDMMDLTEEMVSWIASEMHGSMTINYQGQEVDLSPPWKRITMDEALTQVAGIPLKILNDP